MNTVINSQIISYLKTNPRNKIIIHRGMFDELAYLDLGVAFSKLLQPILDEKYLSLKALDILDKLLLSTVIDNVEIGKVLPLTNCGILFEKELHLDILALIDKYSKDTILILDWQGAVEDHHLYFLDKLNGISLDISNISHLLL
jgi:hypothetical protein